MSDSEQGNIQKGLSFSFFRIHILQSLPTGEYRTGFHLLQRLKDLPGTSGHLAYAEPATPADLIRELGTIRSQLQATGQFPIIHIETHGCPDGLILAEGFLPWSTLKEILIEINFLCHLNLLLVLSACHGENFVRAVRLSDRSPVWGCIGPRTSISAGKLLDGFQSFYRELLSSSDLRSAVEALDGGLPNAQRPLVLWPAQYFFRVAYRGYLEMECTDLRIAERVDRIAENLTMAAANQGEIPQTLRKQIETDLRDHERHFEKYRRIFFMVDDYPENEERFKLRFTDVSARCGQNP
jgi:hypothetical protein